MYVFLYNTIKWPFQPKHSPGWNNIRCHSFRYSNINTRVFVTAVVSTACIKISTIICFYIIVRPSRHYFYYLLLVSTTIWPAFTFTPTAL